MECLLCSKTLSSSTALVNPFRGSSSSVIQTFCKVLALRLDDRDFGQDQVTYCLPCTQLLNHLHLCVQQLEQLEVKIGQFKTEIIAQLLKPRQQPLILGRKSTPLLRLRRLIVNDLNSSISVSTGTGTGLTGSSWKPEPEPSPHPHQRILVSSGCDALSNPGTGSILFPQDLVQTQSLGLVGSASSAAVEIMTMTITPDLLDDLDRDRDPRADPLAPEQDQESEQGQGQALFAWHEVDIKFTPDESTSMSSNPIHPVPVLEPEFQDMNMMLVEHQPEPEPEADLVELKFDPEDVVVTTTTDPNSTVCVHCSQPFGDLDEFIEHTRTSHFPGIDPKKVELHKSSAAAELEQLEQEMSSGYRTSGSGSSFTLSSRERKKLRQRKHYNDHHYVNVQDQNRDDDERLLNRVKCPYPNCIRTFANAKQSLQDHILTHTGERPFSCPVCSKSFITKGQLTRHEPIHGHPFKCVVQDCFDSFRAQPLLMNHLRIWHKIDTSGGSGNEFLHYTIPAFE